MEGRFNLLGRRGDSQREERQPPLSRRSLSSNEGGSIAACSESRDKRIKRTSPNRQTKTYMLSKVFAQNFGALNVECPIFQNV
jgi:hypothetical protein